MLNTQGLHPLFAAILQQHAQAPIDAARLAREISEEHDADLLAEWRRDDRERAAQYRQERAYD
jgi:hypothetical protein